MQFCAEALSLLFPLPLSWFYVSTQRKPEEESPVKDTDAKQAKQEATVNGSGDSSASKEGKSQEASDRLLCTDDVCRRTRWIGCAVMMLPRLDGQT